MGGFEWVFVEAGLRCLPGSGGVCGCGCGGREGTAEYMCVCVCACARRGSDVGVGLLWCARIMLGCIFR